MGNICAYWNVAEGSAEQVFPALGNLFLINEAIMKPFVVIAILFWFIGLSPVVGAEENRYKTVLDQFIETALRDNPELLEAKKRIEVKGEIPSQAGSLDDPMFQFELKSMPVDTFDFGQEPMTQKLLTLSQKLPYPGKLGLRSEIALKEMEIARENLEDLKLKIKKQVKKYYYELSFILEAIKITKQNKLLLKQFVAIAESKYSVGKGVQQDVLKAQVELSQIIDKLIQLNKKKESIQAKLNTLMNLLPQAPITVPQGMTKTPFNYPLEELQKMAEENRPVLKQIIRLKERFQASKKLAEKEYYPNFNVGFRYGQREDGPKRVERPDFLSAFVGINIPLWHKTKQRRKVSQESFQIERVQEAYNNTKNQIYLKVKELMDEENQGSETLDLIGKGILPQARQSLESALAGYPVDKVDFLTLLNNQVTLFNWEIKYFRELSNYEKTLAELEHAVGKGLF
ncbi:hypothetical protein UR09_05370 [Candidatus Nitromaritima sp. SCGC AAA799-A02]|nr:hypothetical protein UR09_05370 [Candidatus Nitromaritima sp. SCGC AAA799-A02]KMP11436.1 hypothetical protein UZ36_04515 [Candidatus Nitromaritima sp. SCGC AAA799-C22]